MLQLNFGNHHNSRYRKLVKAEEKQILNGICHPVFKRRKTGYFRETLAWARLDIDFERDECLIEEIQSDWVRDAKDLTPLTFCITNHSEARAKLAPLNDALYSRDRTLKSRS